MTKLKKGVITVKDLIRVLTTYEPEDLVGFSYPTYNISDGTSKRLDLATNVCVDWLEFEGKERRIIVLEVNK